VHLRPVASRLESSHISFVYESSSPHLRLTWSWAARNSHGPVEHSILIENLEPYEIWIPLQPSFIFDMPIPREIRLQQVYVDKGAGKPTAIGTHLVNLTPGYQWEGESSTYANDAGPREIIPWFMVSRSAPAKEGWYAGIEFSGRTSMTLARGENSVSGAVGLNPSPSGFHTRLPPGASFEAPTIFLGAFKGDLDDAGNGIRSWVKEVLTNPKSWDDPTYPNLVNNSWGSGMLVDEATTLRMIDDSAKLGLEMFHLDAGWFRSVGDWYPDPIKFPHGLAVIADASHQHGLKFGIWVNWAEAGIGENPGALNADDPRSRDWLVAGVPPAWKPEPFVGRSIDLGAPQAKDYAQQELDRIITSYKLDMVEHDGYVVARACTRADHPHAAPPASYPVTIDGSGAALPLASNSTDVSYHAVRAYYSIYSALREEHPGLLFEVCDDGGRMVDFGSASHGDYFSITDSYDPVSNRQAFYDVSHVLPPAMLEDYMQSWPTPRIENFRYMLRSGMMGWATVMQDTNAWTREQHIAARREFALYKTDLRPYIRDADLYHISERADGINWDGLEYFSEQRRGGVVFAFHGSAPKESTHIFAIRGVHPDRRYRVRFFDHSSSDSMAYGRDLLTKGLTVRLPGPNSSELIFLEEDQR
jgi:hypothetical protein